ncbi:MAG: alpha/beta fold hydrolase [Sedimentisphaerales bacterium]|nr:alpha/beta fold hydrolase [Sedimentisphaerales bacterium]
MKNVSDGRRTGWLRVMLLLALLGGCAAPHGYKVSYYYTQTDDGITLALRRYEPDKIALETNPVILCHGFSYNLMFWDLAEQVSLPRYLAEAGYDVWSLSLRGAAPSSQPFNSALRKLTHFHIDPEMLKTLQKRLTDVKMTDWSVDDHIRYDIPAALRLVRDKTQARRVHWIGHSMGGMIMFAYLGQSSGEQVDAIKSFVAVAVPMTVFHPLNDPFQFLLDSEPAMNIGSRVVGSSAPATLGVLFGDLGMPLDRLFYNGPNLSDDVLRRLFQQAEEDIATSQFRQLMQMVRTERFMSLDRSLDYTGALSRVRQPAYLLCGSVDNMATVGAVQYAYRQIQSPIKEYRLFGRINSQRNDYGHNDLVIGKNVRREVYPTILDWLKKFPRSLQESELLLQPRPLEAGNPAPAAKP